MTDKAYQTKKWLNRLIDLYDRAEKIRNQINVMESYINNAVSNYENSGRGRTDLIVRQQQREDALLTYSMKQAEYDKEYMKFVREELITINVLDRMENRRHAVLLFDRYINRLKWEDIIKSKRYDMKKSQLLNHHTQALEELALLLATEEPRAIQETDKAIHTALERIKQATA